MSLNSMPLPVQEIAPVLVGSSNRVTRNCQSWRDPRRVGPGGKNSCWTWTNCCWTRKHETLIVPGKTGGPDWPPGPPGPQLVAWHNIDANLTNNNYLWFNLKSGLPVRALWPLEFVICVSGTQAVWPMPLSIWQAMLDGWKTWQTGGGRRRF